MLKQYKTTKDKLTFIQNLLSGQIDLSNYRTPYHYNAMQQDDGSYEIKSWDDKSAPTTLSEEQFRAWCGTLREGDLLFVCSNLNAPIEEPEELQARYEAERVQHRQKEAYAFAQQTSPVESLKKRRKNDRKKQEADSVLVSVPKRSGSLSEYGQSWELDKQKYYLS